MRKMIITMIMAGGDLGHKFTGGGSKLERSKVHILR